MTACRAIEQHGCEPHSVWVCPPDRHIPKRSYMRRMQRVRAVLPSSRQHSHPLLRTKDTQRRLKHRVAEERRCWSESESGATPPHQKRTVQHDRSDAKYRRHSNCPVETRRRVVAYPLNMTKSTRHGVQRFPLAPSTSLR